MRKQPQEKAEAEVDVEGGGHDHNQFLSRNQRFLS